VASLADEAPGGGAILAVDRWFIETLNVPPYPEERVYRAIASDLCARYGSGITLTVQGQSTLLGTSAVTATCAQL
jgi:hypothetical protein